MHWFWRATIAAVVGMGLMYLYDPFPYTDVFHSVLISYLGSWPGTLAMHTPVLIVTTATYGILTRRYYRLKGFDNETRCRKCGYILRGISEPRCSECGERI